MRDSLNGVIPSGGSNTVLFGGSFLKKDPGDFLLFSDPAEIIELRSFEDTHSFFGKLGERLAGGFCLAGYIGYEAGYGFEPESFGSFRAGDSGLPLAWFGVYGAPRLLNEEQTRQMISGDCRSGEPVFDLTKEVYAEKIGKIRQHIAAGNVYQVNFTGRYRFDFAGSVPGLFGRLSGRQPDVYSAWLNPGTCHILSLSPELFFRCKGKIIEARPMKGTSSRGTDEEDDRLKRDWLQSDEKNRAENLMIVDLLRNDLGKICRSGSVETPELFVVETYPTLHQMVSAVRGELKDDCSLYDLFRAVFPCGSVTGAPKIRAMQLIQQFEGSPRGVYTGAIGYMLPDRSMCFNVAIRTLTLRGEQGEYGAGGGIVWDSDAGEEFAECSLKAKILDPQPDRDFGIFETMLFNGSYVWLEKHLSRLQRSALGLGFSFSGDRIRRELEILAEHEFAAEGRYKVRLELLRDGRLEIAFDEISVQQMHVPVRVCRSSVVLEADDPLRGHKTTRRQLYDECFRKAVAGGYDEVVFCNDRGEITEGAISNIIIFKNGWYYTPQLASGLLNGIYRQYFLETRYNVHESVLTIEDIERADLFFVCNSVRGLKRAVLCEEVV